jgi:hypothetical protein
MAVSNPKVGEKQDLVRWPASIPVAVKTGRHRAAKLIVDINDSVGIRDPYFAFLHFIFRVSGKQLPDLKSLR